MTWSIRGIVLPIDPSSVSKKTQRVQQPVASVGDFPDPILNQPAKFELQIKGYVWPRWKAKALDEACKNADTENVPIAISDESDPWLAGTYSVSRSDINQNKPIFTREAGVDVEVFEYNITFAKFADAGTNQDSDEAGPEEDEISTGFLDMDADGDGKIDLEGLYNFLTSIFTWGASDNP